MKKFFPFILVVAFSFAQGSWVKKGESEVSIGNDYFSLHLSKEKGWLADRLEDKEAGVIFADFHIYTDYGIYERGYVGSKEEKEGRLEIEEGGDSIKAIAEGELKRAGRKISEPIGYRVIYKIGEKRELEVEVELTTKGNKRVSAFLAQLFTVPSVQQWFVNGLDGMISENVGKIIGRCWESHLEPLNLDSPFIIFLREKNIVRIEGIKSNPKAQNIFLFDGGGGNLVFFLGFMDGNTVELPSKFKASYLIKWE
ncbi:hypothetical protein H5T88_06500 [bacterium]|nr:hypothetical protein [bacterium]